MRASGQAVASLVAHVAAVLCTTMADEGVATRTHSQAAALIKAGEAGSGEEALRTMKEKSLQEIYRFLAINLGEPPTEFEWRYKAKSKDEKEDEMVEVADKNLTFSYLGQRRRRSGPVQNGHF